MYVSPEIMARNVQLSMAIMSGINEVKHDVFDRGYTDDIKLDLYTIYAENEGIWEGID